VSAAGKIVGPKAGGTYVERVRQRWVSVPDWVNVLAMHADLLAKSGSGVADLADRLGCKASAVSAVIGKTYAGRYDHMEALVRGALMSEKVECPLLGSVNRADCAKNQKLPFSAASPERAKLFRACRSGCLHAFGGQSS
jgi:hypothetical protein